MKQTKIPAITINRLSFYARYLFLLDLKDVNVISSTQLARACGVNSAQIRKDLAYFGQFGVRGIGYYVKDLLAELQRILGLNKKWRLGLVGVGNLGAALLRHTHIHHPGYTFVNAFDHDPKRIGVQVGNLIVDPVDEMEETVKTAGIQIGVIATRNKMAQQSVDRFIKGGVRGILSFATVQLQIPPDVHIEHVDFILKLDALCYRLTAN